MYTKDYLTTQQQTGASQQKSSMNTSITQPKTSVSQNNGQSSTSLNKSLENVIRKAAYKGIEPLRRRYTQVTQQ